MDVNHGHKINTRNGEKTSTTLRPHAGVSRRDAVIRSVAVERADSRASGGRRRNSVAQLVGVGDKLHYPRRSS